MKNAPLPFALAQGIGDRWSALWADQRLHVAVAGDERAPDPALSRAVRAVVERWPEVRHAIVAYAAALPPDHRVPLEPSRLGGFAARTCGFDGEITFESIVATDPTEPDRVEVTFWTGHPDGYATFRVVLVRGRPTAIIAIAS